MYVFIKQKYIGNDPMENQGDCPMGNQGDYPINTQGDRPMGNEKIIRWEVLFWVSSSPQSACAVFLFDGEVYRSSAPLCRTLLLFFWDQRRR